MNGSGNQLLAGAALTGYEHARAIEILQSPNVLEDLAERFALAHETLNTPSFHLAIRDQRKLIVGDLLGLFGLFPPRDFGAKPLIGLLQFAILLNHQAGEEAVL